MLGNEVLEILDEIKTLKRRLAFTVTPESQPIQQVMVGGVAGAGKSTLVNHLMRHCLKMEDAQPDEPADVEIEDKVFSAGGPAPSDLSATQRDEEKVRAEAQKDDDVQYRFNISGEDILPTGSGAGAMTALVTHIFLDPTASHLQLRLKYKERAEVETVLGYAETIREHGRKLMDGDELPELPDIQDASGKDVDVTTQAYFACALLGLENKPDSPKRGGGSDDDDSDDDDTECDAPDAGVEQLQRHKGAFKLPERFEPLYGCERRLTLRGSSKSKLLARMQELLLVHTIGHWSHWAVRTRCSNSECGPKRCSHLVRLLRRCSRRSSSSCRRICPRRSVSATCPASATTHSTRTASSSSPRRSSSRARRSVFRSSTPA
jgi:hypothetical protein